VKSRVALVALLAAACSDRGAPEATGQDRQAIVHGEPAIGETAIVAFLVDGVVGPSCSGVVLGPRLVLTARHCVSKVIGRVRCSESGELLAGGRVVEPIAPGLIGVATDPSAGPVAHGLRAFTPDVTHTCNADLAVLVLDVALPSDVRPALLAPADRPLPSTTTVVGWGMTEAGFDGLLHRREDVPVELVGPAAISDALGAVGPREYVLGEGVCFGDSGGAVLDGDGAVVGIVSRVTNGAPLSSGDPVQSRCRDLPGYPAKTVAIRSDALPELLERARAFTGDPPPPSDGCVVTRTTRPHRTDLWVGALLVAVLAAWKRRRR
jgi:hypothetical protein